MSKANKNTLQTYFAKKDGMFGIKKDDRFTFEKNVFTQERTGKILPIDPTTEPSYFELEIPTKYKRNDLLMLLKPTSFRPTTGGGNFTIPAFEPLRVMNVKKTTSYRKDIVAYTVKMENSSPAKNFQYDIGEVILVPYVTYHFINSKGQISRGVEGKDAKADAFRKKVKNFFETSEEAQKRLKEL